MHKYNKLKDLIGSIKIIIINLTRKKGRRSGKERRRRSGKLIKRRCYDYDWFMLKIIIIRTLTISKKSYLKRLKLELKLELKLLELKLRLRLIWILKTVITLKITKIQ